MSVEHRVFAVFCEKCRYNVVGFLRNYFASMKCYCLGMEKNEFCKQRHTALNYCVRKVCVESKDVPAEVKLDEVDKYLMRRLDDSPIFFVQKNLTQSK